MRNWNGNFSGNFTSLINEQVVKCVCVVGNAGRHEWTLKFDVSAVAVSYGLRTSHKCWTFLNKYFLLTIFTHTHFLCHLGTEMDQSVQQMVTFRTTWIGIRIPAVTEILSPVRLSDWLWAPPNHQSNRYQG